MQEVQFFGLYFPPLIVADVFGFVMAPIPADRLLQRQRAAFSEEIAGLASAAPDERKALARSLRHCARMATVWWSGLSAARDRQAEA